MQHPVTEQHEAVPETQHRVCVDLLNAALGKEIATTLQYLYFHARFEDARYLHLSQIMRRIAIAEMRHIEEFSDRILFLEGDIDMNPAFRTRQMEDPTEMLRFAVHLDTFRAELDHLEQYGERYLALQAEAGSRHAAQELGRANEAFEKGE